MTKLQAIRWFGKMVLEEDITIARDKFSTSNWGMDVIGKIPRIKTPKNLTYKSDLPDKMFRANFIERCPLAQGFSNVTLTLLHEFGHWATRYVLDIVGENFKESEIKFDDLRPLEKDIFVKLQKTISSMDKYMNLQLMIIVMM